MSQSTELPKLIQFDVTTPDIEQGKVCNTLECVVSQALKRLGHTDVEVMADRTYIGKAAYWHERELIDYIKAFDKGNTSLAQFVIYHIDNRKASPKLGRPTKKASKTNNETGNSKVVDGSIEVGPVQADD